MDQTLAPFAADLTGDDFRSLLDQMLEGCTVVDHDWRFAYVNDAALPHARKTRRELIGSTIMEAYPGIEHTFFFERMVECMTSRVSATWLNEFEHGGVKGWYELRIEPHQHGLIIFSNDATERKLLEQ